MKFLQAYINQWGYGELIEPVKCIGRFLGCLPECPLDKCEYRQG